jgi:hypothetical protein
MMTVPGGRIVGTPVEQLLAVRGRGLSPYQARVALMLTLTRSRDRQRLSACSIPTEPCGWHDGVTHPKTPSFIWDEPNALD